jgi:hypothetical protein
MSSSVADPSSQQQQQASKVHQLEVALAEITSLPPKRAVYEKRGTIFFRSTVAAATKSQQSEGPHHRLLHSSFFPPFSMCKRVCSETSAPSVSVNP